MVDQYTSSVNVPSEVKALAPMGMAKMAGGEGEESLGSTLFQLSQKLQETKNLRYEANATAQINAITDDYIASLADKDPNKFDFVGGYDALQEKQNKVLAGLPRAVQDQMQNKLVLQRQSDKAYIAKYAIDKTIRLNDEEFPDRLKNAAMHGQDDDALKAIRDTARIKGLSDDWIESRTRDYQAMKTEVAAQNVMTQFQAIINAGGTKEQGYAAIDGAYKDGLITSKQVQVLGDQLDSYIEGRIAKETMQAHEKMIKSYQELAQFALTKDFDADRILSSNLPDTEKKAFLKYVKNSRKPSPIKSEASGHEKLNEIVMQYSEDTDRQTAYNALFKLRYGQETITDADFAWGMTKIDKPYDLSIVPEVKSILGSPSWRWGSNAEQAQMESNRSFIKWLDNEIAAGKTPEATTMREVMAKIKSNEPFEDYITPKGSDLSKLTDEELIKIVMGR